MQKLEFKSSWNKALSSKDRENIEEIFLEASKMEFLNVCFSPIRQALNHKGELLITVLIHNFTQQALTFVEKRLVYVENDEIIADYIFTLSTLIIQPEVSMPWTFIFPVSSLKRRSNLEKGHLEIL